MNDALPDHIRAEWKKDNANSRELLGKSLVALYGEYLNQSNKADEEKLNELGVEGWRSPAYNEQRAELKRQYEAAVLALVQEFHEHRSDRIDGYFQQWEAANAEPVIVPSSSATVPA